VRREKIRMSHLVFTRQGIYQVPEACVRYWGLRWRYLSLLARAEREEEEEERQVLRGAACADRLAIEAHLSTCEQCQRWLNALETGAGWVQLSPEEEAAVWRQLGEGNGKRKAG
jgi:hypothetical protein